MGGSPSKKDHALEAVPETFNRSLRENSCLTFHDHHGKNVELSSDKTIATRKRSFCFGIAFSGRSIGINELVHIKLHKVENLWSGVMRFGVTSVDPRTLIADDLPRYACPDLTSRPGFFAKALPDDACVENNILSFFVTQNGFLRLWINNDDLGIFIGDIPTDGPLWVMTDIYGNTSSLQFINELPTSISVNPVQLITEAEASSESSSSSRDSDDENVENASALPDFQDPVASENIPPVSQNVENEFRHVLEIPVSQSLNPTDESSDNIFDELRRKMKLPHPTRITRKKFASKCGPGVRIRNGVVAIQSYSMYSQNPLVFSGQGTESCQVFSAEPLSPDSAIYFKIVSAYSSMDVMVGVTSCKPDTLIPEFLPDNAADLVDREEYWVVDRIRDSVSDGDFMSLALRPSGLLVYKINDGDEQELFYCDTSQNLWIVFDLGSFVLELRLVGVSDNLSNHDSSVPSTSNASNNPLRNHDDDDDDDWLPFELFPFQTNETSELEHEEFSWFRRIHDPFWISNIESSSVPLSVQEPPELEINADDEMTANVNFVRTHRMMEDSGANDSESSSPSLDLPFFLARPASGRDPQVSQTLHHVLENRETSNAESSSVNVPPDMPVVFADRPNDPLQSPSTAALGLQPDSDENLSGDHLRPRGRSFSSFLRRPLRAFLRVGEDPYENFDRVEERNLFESQESSSIPPSTSEPSASEPDAEGNSPNVSTMAECSICLEEPANAAIYDCGHVCMCLDCGKNLIRRERFAKCPICRSTIKDIIRLYHS